MTLKRSGPLLLALCLPLLAAPRPAPAQPGANDPYAALVTREYGTAVDEMQAIDKQVQMAKPEEYPAIEARLIPVIDNPNATMAGKQYALQTLRVVGSARCVPSVAKLLSDDLLSHMARNVLLGMTDPAAAQVLRDALGKSQGKLRIGLINTIGDRGDGGALPALSGLLATGDALTTDVVLEAMGKMGTVAAADALDRAKVADALKPNWSQAYLRCATGLTARGDTARAQKMYHALLAGGYPSQVRAGAFREIVFAQKEQAVPLIVQTLGSNDKLMRRAALAAVIQVPGTAATAAFARLLPAQTPDGKAVLLAALATRGDAAGLTELVNKYANDPDPTVREAAIEALGRLGNASSATVLVVALNDPAYGAGARSSLVALRGDGVAQSLVGQVEGADPALRANLLGVLADRKQVEALPAARKLANDNDAKTRQAAVNVLSALGTQEDLQGLTDAMLAAKDDGQRETLARALTAIGTRLPDKGKRDDTVLQAWAKADAPTKVQLLPVLQTFGGDRPLQTTRGALAEPGEVHRAAVRALANWSDQAPLADLHTVAKGDDDATVRILALRGWITMVGKSNLKPEEKVTSLHEAMDLSTRPEEKRQVLSEIGKVGSPDALNMVEPSLTDDSVKREAWQAYEQIAESLVDRQPAIAKEALQKVVATTTDNGLHEKAQTALARIK